MKTQHKHQRGAAVLLSSAFMTAGLLLVAQQIQAKINRDLNTITEQIRVEQTVQIEQAGRNYIKALQAQSSTLSSALSDSITLHLQCLGLNIELPEPRKTIATFSPPNFRAVGTQGDAGAAQLKVQMIAGPSQYLCSNLVSWSVSLLASLIGVDLEQTRQKYQSVASVGCTGGTGVANSQAERIATCVTRSSKLHVDR